MRTYAGIGSRETPVDVLQLAEMTASRLAEHGWVLRSGHAPGADQAFEGGAGERAEIYLPWPSFEKGEPLQARWIYDTPSTQAAVIAATFHPAWDRLKQGAKKLHARNVHQILGPNCDDPVKFVLCWTTDGRASGGTGQAIRIAEAHGIPVFNLFHDEVLRRVEGFTLSHVT